MVNVEFEQQLQAAVGQPTGPYHSWDRVNRAMIRHWCDAMGDANPAYRDPQVATAVGGDGTGVVAPPTMLQAWIMVGYGDRHPPGSDQRPSVPVLDLFDEHGYQAVVATNCEQDYLGPVCEGDELSYHSSIESIVGEKRTALGAGYFVTQLMQFHNQREQLVGEMRFRILKYKPAGDE